jgi:PAS domain S-box-containing protein
MKLKISKFRELFDLSAALFVVVAFSLFTLCTNFLSSTSELLGNFKSWAPAELFSNAALLWLSGLLWITYRRWRETREREKELQDIIASISPDVLMAVDSESKIIMCNSSMKSLFGYEIGEVIGKQVDLLYSEGNDGSLSERQVHDSPRRETLNIGLATGKKKNGDTVPLEIITGKLHRHAGKVVLLRDITQRKRMEEEREEMQGQLLEARKMEAVETLAGGVAHDFNNVLAAILGRAQLLKKQINHPLAEEKRKLSETLQPSLDVIEKAALDGADTVRRLQEFSIPGTRDGQITEVDVSQLLKDVLEFTRVRWKDEAESKGVQVDIAKELSPGVFVAGHPSELREVFTNIIHNALDSMPGGGKIKTTTSRKNGRAFIRIEDTGIGIPSEIKDKVFDPFFTTKGPRSAGLGMSVSYGIIGRHQGTIRVESMEGKGAAFMITLPLADGKKESEKAVAVSKSNRKARILVIEDEESVRELLFDILIGSGHEVDTASHGAQGLDLFKRKEFDLVFTDLGMPGMSGWEVAREIRKLNGVTPVSLITGWNVQQLQDESSKSTVDFVLHKPFQEGRVLRLIQEALALRETQVGIEGWRLAFC